MKKARRDVGGLLKEVGLGKSSFDVSGKAFCGCFQGDLLTDEAFGMKNDDDRGESGGGVDGGEMVSLEGPERSTRTVDLDFLSVVTEKPVLVPDILVCFQISMEKVQKGIFVGHGDSFWLEMW